MRNLKSNTLLMRQKRNITKREKRTSTSLFSFKRNIEERKLKKKDNVFVIFIYLFIFFYEDVCDGVLMNI